jgi:hypothetical protein
MNGLVLHDITMDSPSLVVGVTKSSGFGGPLAILHRAYTREIDLRHSILLIGGFLW